VLGNSSVIKGWMLIAALCATLFLSFSVTEA
jgi:hypothetical protein